MIHRRAFLGAAAATAWAADAVHYEDKKNLLSYLDSSGRKRPVRSAAEWRRRVNHIRANMELVMGQLPAVSAEPIDLRVAEENRLSRYTRQRVTFVPEKGDRVPAFLLIPHERAKPLPAMICLPGSSKPGKDIPAGLMSNRPDQMWAHELAELGFVCLVLDYPLLHNSEYATDPYALGYASATMKGIVNHRRGIDVLQSLPYVATKRIGVIGHSLGGHNALFLAVFEERIQAIVSSCGFNVFAKHAGGDVSAWSSRFYMPRIKSVYGNDPAKIPFDFTEVLAALAPRTVFVNAPLHDQPDFEVSGVRDCVDAALPVYRDIFRAADKLIVQYPDAKHEFPKAQRDAAYRVLGQALASSRQRNQPLAEAWDLKAGELRHS
ncbi:MAG TPA: alpha/beta hydrolase family protein [Bryobacteraceae bacterium]|nr:alpha/beta hydrolase family protein [Bryobacteraceae bacterium]